MIKREESLELHPQARVVRKLFLSHQETKSSEGSDSLTTHAYISRRAPTQGLIKTVLSTQQKTLSIQGKVTLSSADLQKKFPDSAYPTKLDDSELAPHRIKHWHLKEDLLANKNLKKIAAKKEIHAVNNRRVTLLVIKESPLTEAEQQSAAWQELLKQKEKPYFQMTPITHFLNRY